MKVGDIVIVNDSDDIAEHWRGKRARIVETNIPGRYSIRLARCNGYLPSSIFEADDFTPDREHNIKKLLTNLKL